MDVSSTITEHPSELSGREVRMRRAAERRLASAVPSMYMGSHPRAHISMLGFVVSSGVNR